MKGLSLQCAGWAPDAPSRKQSTVGATRHDENHNIVTVCKSMSRDRRAIFWRGSKQNLAFQKLEITYDRYRRCWSESNSGAIRNRQLLNTLISASAHLRLDWGFWPVMRLPSTTT